MGYRVLLAIAAMTLPAVDASAAVLLGSMVDETYYYPDESTPHAPVTYTPQSFVVGPGQESTIDLEGVTTFNVDFGDATLDLLFDTTLPSPTFGNSSFNGLIFTSTAFGAITGVTVDPSTNLAGFDVSRVTVAGNALKLNWAGLSYNTDTLVSLSFASASAAVPEPSTWLMLIAGFGLVGGAMRRSLGQGRSSRVTRPA